MIGPDRVLAFDLSTHTGWAFFISSAPILRSSQIDTSKGRFELMDFGLFEMEKLPEQFGNYPQNYITAVEIFTDGLVSLVQKFQPDTIVIEETVPGQETYSQKMLDFIHYSFVKKIRAYQIVYLRTGEWRKTVNLRMSKEDLKGNQKANLVKAKNKARELRAQIKVLGTKKQSVEQVSLLKQQLNSLQLGKVTRKHLAVRKVNELFGLDLILLDNDTADAILLGVAYLNGASACDGKRPTAKEKK